MKHQDHEKITGAVVKRIAPPTDLSLLVQASGEAPDLGPRAAWGHHSTKNCDTMARYVRQARRERLQSGLSRRFQRRRKGTWFIILAFVALIAVGGACGAGRIGDTWTRPADDMVMVYVPAGEFQMGSTDAEVDAALDLCNQYWGDCQRGWFEDEQPAHTVALDGFWIDRTQVTHAQYFRCVADGDCAEPQYRGWYLLGADTPVVGVDWYNAVAYCESAGARLPTEAEWEYAARGPDRRTFPWGDTFDCTRLNFCDANCGLQGAADYDDGYRHTAPVGSYPDGASWCGALDMAGNVVEWVADWYGPYPSGRQVNPTGPSAGEKRVLRGGSYYSHPGNTRCANRFRREPVDAGDEGFRCARGSE